MTDETATERVRELLDGRGVEWEDNTPAPSMKQWRTSFVSFTGEEVTLSCYDEPKWILGTLVFHTPEQAIEATLGRGKLTAEQVKDAVLDNFEETHETRYDHWEP